MEGVGYEESKKRNHEEDQEDAEPEEGGDQPKRLKTSEEPRSEQNEEEEEEEHDDVQLEVAIPTESRWWEGSSFAYENGDTGNEHCAVCDQPGELVLCDGPCDRAFHLDCIGLQLEDLPEGDWYCSKECQAGAKAMGKEGQAATQAAEEKPKIGANTEGRQKILLDAINSQLSTKKYREKAKDWQEASCRAMNYLYRTTLNKDHFRNFGADVLTTFYDVATFSPEPLRKFALQRVELLAQRWVSKFKTLKDMCDSDEDDAEIGVGEVIMAIYAIYALERAGIYHELKHEVKKYLKENKHPVKEYISFDPRRLETLEADNTSRFFKFTNSIQATSSADKIGMNIGITMPDLFKLLPQVKRGGYRDNFSDFSRWIDQITMIFNITHVCSNNGELSLQPSLFPDEVAYLKDPKNLDICIKHKDIHMVGEICHCLRVFGEAEDHPLIVKGVEFLIKTQLLDGSWPTRNNENDAYTKYHACMCALFGLVRVHTRGFGPGNVQLTQVIREISLKNGEKVRSSDLSQASTGIAKGPSMKSFDHLKEYYRKNSTVVAKVVAGGTKDGMGVSIGGVSMESLMDSSLKGIASQRLDELLKMRKEEEKEGGSGRARSDRRPAQEGWRRGGAVIDKNKLKSMIRVSARALSKDEFLKRLAQFKRVPSVEPRAYCSTISISLYELYLLVSARGGVVSSLDEWNIIAHNPRIQLSSSIPNRPTRLKEFYQQHIGDFPAWWAEEHDARVKKEEVDRKLRMKFGVVPTRSGIKENGASGTSSSRSKGSGSSSNEGGGKVKEEESDEAGPEEEEKKKRRRKVIVSEDGKDQSGEQERPPESRKEAQEEKDQSVGSRKEDPIALEDEKLKDQGEESMDIAEVEVPSPEQVKDEENEPEAQEEEEEEESAASKAEAPLSLDSEEVKEGGEETTDIAEAEARL